jgi:NitT/TauT family transport system permease protein
MRFLRRWTAAGLYPTAVFVLLIAAWEIAARTGVLPAYVVPAPSAILVRFVSTFHLMLWHSALTSYEIFAGFLLGTVVGIGLAGLILSVRVFEQALYPWLVVLQVVPKVAIGPLLVVWLGVTVTPKILIAFLLAFFPVMIAAISGLRSADASGVLLLRSMGASAVKRFWYLQLPNALPQILASMKVAVTLAVVGAIVGEFVGADEGLGYVLITAAGSLDAVLMFVALLWITLISLVFYAAVAWFEQVIVGWHVSIRGQRSVVAG